MHDSVGRTWMPLYVFHLLDLAALGPGFPIQHDSTTSDY